jgi:iron complex transport system substrate-binding protein
MTAHSYGRRGGEPCIAFRFADMMTQPRKTPRPFRAARPVISAAAGAALASVLAVAAVLANPGAPHAQTPPSRVVSMNLCTDQLAMLIAAPGQLHSVSHLARREDASVLFSEAAAYAVNHGEAEEIFLMKPDLVLAGTFSARATVSLLRRLGMRVEEFAAETSFADIRANITRMGDLLGQREKADTLVAQLDQRLAAYTAGAEQHRPLAALYYANSYSSGGGTLAGEAVERAGLANLAARLGLNGTVKLPLEVLVMNAPDLVVGGERASGSREPRAYDNLDHPALRKSGDSARVAVPDKYWICGAPFTAEAVRILAEAAGRLR